MTGDELTDLIADPETVVLDARRLLVERDALKSECIRMMDEIAALKRELAGAVRPPAPPAPESPVCGNALDCGGACHLLPHHLPPCLCSGDMDGPGSCPA